MTPDPAPATQAETKSPPIRAIIADDERLARKKLRILLDSEPEVQVVAECKDG